MMHWYSLIFVSPRKQKLLKKAGINVDAKGEKKREFEERIKAYRDFWEKNGRFPKKKSSDLKEKRLGEWIASLRRASLGEAERAARKSKRNLSTVRLPPWKQELLKKAGISLDPVGRKKQPGE